MCWHVPSGIAQKLDPQHHEQWAIALQVLSARVDLISPADAADYLRMLRLPDTRCAPLCMEPIRSEKALPVIDVLDKFVAERPGRLVVDCEELLDRKTLVCLSRDFGAEYCTVWMALEPFLTEEESSVLAESALGQTTLKNLALLLRATPPPYKGRTSQQYYYDRLWGYWTIPLMLKFGPGAVEQIAMDAYSEELELDLFRAYAVLVLGNSDAPLAWRLELI